MLGGLVRDIRFVLKWMRWPTSAEISKRAWIAGVIMLVVGFIGFLIHTVMSLV